MVPPQPDLCWGVIQCWSPWKVFNGYIISFHASWLWGTQWLLFLRILRVPETHRVFSNPVYFLYLVSSSLKICEGNLLCAGTWLCSPCLGYQSLFREVSQLPGVSYASPSPTEQGVHDHRGSIYLCIPRFQNNAWRTKELQFSLPPTTWKCLPWTLSKTICKLSEANEAEKMFFSGSS